MFNAEDLHNDTRFYIDERNVQRLLANGGGQKYTTIFVGVGSIMRSLDGKITSLYCTDVYAYLQGTEEGKKKYEDYCKLCNVSFRTEQNYADLITEIDKTEYDIKKGAIVIDENNFILDGQHRACILLKKYGPFYKVEVVKMYFRTYYSWKFKCKLFYYKCTATSRCVYEYVKRIFH